MGGKKYIVELSDEDRKTLEWFTSTGERRAQDNTRARILLKADDGLTDLTISEHVGCHPQTVHNTRKDYTERGIAAIHRRKPDRESNASSRRKRRSQPSNSPAANRQKDTRWTLHLLADELVTLDEIDFESISHEAVRQRLKTP